MKRRLYPATAILLATLWISVSEFVRNELLVKSIWVEHYQKMGLTFPSEPLNGVVWGVWSLFFAIFIFIISRKYTLMQATFITWFAGFVLMWIVAYNLLVLPLQIMPYAIPLSMLECFVASLIVRLAKDTFKTA